MNAVRSAGEMTSSMVSNVPPQRSSTIRSSPKGPAPRFLRIRAEIGPQSFSL
jgi:hypothetical protein